MKTIANISLLIANAIITFVLIGCNSIVPNDNILGDIEDDVKHYYETELDYLKQAEQWIALQSTGISNSSFEDKILTQKEEIAKIIDNINEKKDGLVGKTLSTDVEEGTPLKIVSPFKIIDVIFKGNADYLDFNITLVMEAEVETTANIHSQERFTNEGAIGVNYWGSNGEKNYSGTVGGVDYKQDIPKGTRLVLNERVEEMAHANNKMEISYRLVNTQRLSIYWNPPVDAAK